MRPFLLVVFVAAVLYAGCSEDTRVLWQRDSDGGDEGGSAGESPGTGALEPVFPEGGGGMGRPDPGVQYCFTEDMQEQTCECFEGTPCVCVDSMNTEMMQCSMACVTSSCDMRCSSTAVPCNADCDVGCVIQCDPFTSCTIGCGEACNVVCHEGAYCSLWSWGGKSEIYCAPGAICECMIPENCECSGAGCMF